MKITVLHHRDPDAECDVTVYVDGVRVPAEDVSVDDIDPGRGYEREDYEENLELAHDLAHAPGATDYDRDYLAALEAAEPTYRKWATGEWTR